MKSLNEAIHTDDVPELFLFICVVSIEGFFMFGEKKYLFCHFLVWAYMD